MSRQRPSRDQPGPPLASGTQVLAGPSIQGSRRAGGSRNERRHVVTLVTISVALHLALGLLSALVIGPAPVMKETPPLVEMVFDAAPMPQVPAQAPASTVADESPVEPSKAAQDTPADIPAGSPPAGPPPSPPEEPTTPPMAEPLPTTQALPQAPPVAEPSPTEVERAPPAPMPLPDPPLSEPAKLQKLDRPVSPAPPAASAASVPKPPAPDRPVPPRPRPAPRAAQQPSAPALPAFPNPAASLPEPARPSNVPLTSSSPVAAAPAPSPSAVNGTWRSALAAWVQSRKRYPDEARRQSMEGQVAVRFTVGRDGQVLDAQVAHGSGSDLLDQAALSMFRGGRAPSFPADMSQSQLTTTISIRFRLQE